MTANELRNKSFDKSAFGFKTDEVSECIMEAARSLEELERINKELKAENNKLQSTIEEYKNDEESMKSILFNAQKLSSSVVNEAKGKAVTLVEEAQKKSDSMISEATAKTEKMTTEARENSKRVISEATTKANTLLRDAEHTAKSISDEAKLNANREQERLRKMQREVSSFKANLLNIYKTHLDLITKLPEVKEEKTEKPDLDKDEETKAYDVKEGSTIDADSNINEASDNNEEKLGEPKVEYESTSNINDNINDSKKATVEENKSQFKIVITEKDSESPPKEAEKDNNTKKTDYKSRFGELKFGEHSK